jgi:DNA-binding response OmpR family regulator
MSESSKILVVDDEPFILRSVTYVLRKEGFTVLEAHHGEEALEVIRTQNPALVFLDVMMPRKTGYEVLQTMKEEGLLSRCKVVLLTAKGQESDKVCGKELGAHEYMTKPFSPMLIVKTAKEILTPAPVKQR